MKLNQFIKDKYEGNISAFAKDNGILRQQVQQCLAKGYYHVIEIDGESWIVMAKRKVKTC